MHTQRITIAFCLILLLSEVYSEVNPAESKTKEVFNGFTDYVRGISEKMYDSVERVETKQEENIEKWRKIPVTERLEEVSRDQ